MSTSGQESLDLSQQNTSSRLVCFASVRQPVTEKAGMSRPAMNVLCFDDASD